MNKQESAGWKTLAQVNKIVPDALRSFQMTLNYTEKLTRGRVNPVAMNAREWRARNGIKDLADAAEFGPQLAGSLHLTFLQGASRIMGNGRDPGTGGCGLNGTG